MAKVKTPFFSLGAQGSIGGVLTVSNYKGISVAKSIPTHPDAHTPDQLAQRLLYSHGRDLWLTLTPDERAQLLTDGRPYRITGYNLLLRRFLLDQLNLDAWYPLNGPQAAIAVDYSTYLNNFTGFGPSLATDFCGQPDNAAYFDGAGDYYVSDTTLIDYTSQDFSIVMRAYFDSLAVERTLFCNGIDNTRGYRLFVIAGGALYFRTSQTGATQQTASNPGAIVTSGWYTIGISRYGPNVYLALNGIDVTAGPGVHIDPLPNNGLQYIGIYNDTISSPMHGRICDVKFYSRRLSSAEQLSRHQRYCVHPPR